MDILGTKPGSPGASKAGGAGQAEVRHVEVDGDRAGQRLDNFVTGLCKGVPKSHVYQLIRSGQLRVNGGRRAADYRLQAGDVLRLPPMRVPALRPAAAASVERVQRARATLGERLPVLYEDAAIVVIDKPESVAVHGGSGVSSGVIERLRAAWPQARFLELAHRIDRETSGVLVIARKRAALLALQSQWRQRAPAKHYLAVVAGRWPLRSKTLSSRLRRQAAPDGDRRVLVDPEGQEAITRVRGLAHLNVPGEGELSLVEATIETGRTHQIRVHLSHAGFPIVGDDKYGDFAMNRRLSTRGFRRMFLHAASLRLRHPESGEPLVLHAPLPASFATVLEAGGIDVAALSAGIPGSRRQESGSTGHGSGSKGSGSTGHGSGSKESGSTRQGSTGQGSTGQGSMGQGAGPMRDASRPRAAVARTAGAERAGGRTAGGRTAGAGDGVGDGVDDGGER